MMLDNLVQVMLVCESVLGFNSVGWCFLADLYSCFVHCATPQIHLGVKTRTCSRRVSDRAGPSDRSARVLAFLIKEQDTLVASHSSVHVMRKYMYALSSEFVRSPQTNRLCQ